MLKEESVKRMYRHSIETTAQHFPGPDTMTGLYDYYQGMSHAFGILLDLSFEHVEKDISDAVQRGAF